MARPEFSNYVVHFTKRAGGSPSGTCDGQMTRMIFHDYLLPIADHELLAWVVRAQRTAFAEPGDTFSS